jgi:hypothetical protein
MQVRDEIVDNLAPLVETSMQLQEVISIANHLQSQYDSGNITGVKVIALERKNPCISFTPVVAVDYITISLTRNSVD